MSVTHSTAAANAGIDAIVDLIDVGTTVTQGTIQWATSGDATLCATQLQDPAFGTAAAKSSSLLGVPLTSSAATAGTVAKAFFQDQDNTEVFRCAVATSGGDINLSGVVLGTSETITLNSLTYSIT